MKIKFSKDDLLTKLEAMVPIIAADDARQLKAHYVKNKDVAKARRDYLRQFIKLPDDKLAEYSGVVGGRYADEKWPSANSCPLAQAQRLTNQIAFLRNDSRRTITVSDGDQFGQWLTWRPRDDKDGRLC